MRVHKVVSGIAGLDLPHMRPFVAGEDSLSAHTPKLDPKTLKP